MNNPKVSVIMAVYNAEKFVEEAIKSVLNQTFTDFELLIVDDASTDNTNIIVKQFENNDDRIRSVRLVENSGAAVARNTAIKMAQGSYIAFLDADDKWLPLKLEKQLDFFNQNNCAVVYSSYYCMDEDGLLDGQEVVALPRLSLNKLLKCNYIGNLTAMYSVDQLGKLYAPNFRKRQDWALWIKALQLKGEALGIQEPLAVYRIRRDSISANKIEMLSYNFSIYKDFLGFSFVKSSYYMLLFLVEYFFIKKKRIKKSVV